MSISLADFSDPGFDVKAWVNTACTGYARRDEIVFLPRPRLFPPLGDRARPASSVVDPRLASEARPDPPPPAVTP